MDTFDRTNLSQLTCPSKEKVYTKLSNIISPLLSVFDGWWRRWGTNPREMSNPLPPM